MSITRLAYHSELRSKHLPFTAFIQASASTSIITRNTTIHSIQPFKGDCPRYIQQWQLSIRSDSLPATAQWMERLDTDARDLISSADSFFVASYVNDTASGRQVDVSHRGGKPGFVQLDEDGTLTIPDFAGNLFFNTLGNFVLNPKAGLVFVDFSTGNLLHMTGDVELILDSDTLSTVEGAERLWRFSPRRIVRRSNALALSWSTKPDGSSPYSLMTGS